MSFMIAITQSSRKEVDRVGIFSNAGLKIGATSPDPACFWVASLPYFTFVSWVKHRNIETHISRSMTHLPKLNLMDQVMAK